MPDYFIIQSNRITSTQQLGMAEKHNTRNTIPPNSSLWTSGNSSCDIELERLSFSLPKQLSLSKLIDKRLNELDISRGNCKTIALEFIISFSHGAISDDRLNDWCENVNATLHEWADRAPDQKSNIVSLCLHLDEHTPHIHALILPINENGIFSPNDFTFKKSIEHLYKLIEKNAGKEYGLVRGQKSNLPKHQTMKERYNELTNAATVPPAKDNESSTDYYKRVLEHCRSRCQEPRKRECQKEEAKKEQEIKALTDELANLNRANNALQDTYAHQVEKKKQREKEHKEKLLQMIYEEWDNSIFDDTTVQEQIKNEESQSTLSSSYQYPCWDDDFDR